jgi:dihydroorotate dehydrogenase (fumarate)
VKISYYFSGLAEFVTRLSWTGIQNITLFNRFFSPDFDIEHLEVKSSFVFSSPSDIALSLRWIAMLSPHVRCHLSASTGVHDGEAVIKQLLAGAQTVQVVSALYKNGIHEINNMLETLEEWMKRKQFQSIEDFRGKLSLSNYENPAVYERVQFMKHFSGIE